MIRFVWLAAALILVTATPADAAFVAAAVTAISGWLSGLSAVGLLGVRIVTGLAMNAIGRAMQKRAMRRMQQEQRGIRTSMTLTGGENPDGMIMGVYATAGSFVAPWVMHGASNNYNSQVIDLSGVPLTTLRRVYVNGSPIDLGATDAIIDGQNFGKPATGTYDGHLWVKFYDGTQTAADPMLVARGASDPDFPWSADMVGMGRAYAICTYLYNREIWQGVPQFRFELGGARFYDMRKDGSNGGIGAHRLDNPATWEGTDNPIVAVAHLAMGYELPDGSIYGGGYTLADLPLSDWAAAMNACDALVAGSNGQEPAWRAGFEIAFDEEPLDAINSLLQVCDGEIADVGGRLYVKVGAPGLPVAFITDDDLIVSEAEDLDPFPGLQQTVNGISISHPDPSAAWENTEAPRILDAALEADDGGRRLIQSLALPACPYPLQAQRLGQALLKDARRFARHTLHLPGDLARVRPLQTISWTSARNGYTNKLFELTEQAADLYSYQSQVTLREVDPSDYNPEAYLPLPSISPVVTPPPPATLEGAGAVAWTISNANGDARPAIRAFWTPLSADAVEVEVRLGAEVVAAVVAPAAAGRSIISAEVLPATQYTVRLRIVPAGRPTAWMGPYPVMTPDLRIRAGDLVDSLQTEIDRAFALADGIATGYVWEVDGGGIMRLVQVEDGIGGTPFTAAEIAADYVRITGLTQIDQAVIEDLAVSNAFIDNLQVGTLQIETAAVTQSGVAGSGPVTNNSSSWTTVASFTLPNLPASGFLQGTLSFRLSSGQNNVNNYPTNAEWRVTVNGVVRSFLPRGRFQNPDNPWFFGPFTANVVGPGNVNVVFEMRDQGGFGVNSSNLYAQVAMR